MEGTTQEVNVSSPAPNVTRSFAEDAECEGSELYWQARAVEVLELYAYPLVIVAGSLMNVLAVVVLQIRIYRGTSTGFLLTALSLADLGLLLTGISRRWIRVLTDYANDVRVYSSAGCKIHIFGTYFFQYVSSWTLTLITLERAICVLNPFKCKELCSMKRIIIAWVVMAVVMAAVNAHFFWSYDKYWDSEWEEFTCYGVDAHHTFLYRGAHNWLDLAFPCFGPFAVIIVCNTIIVGKLVRSARERSAMKVSSASGQQTSSTTVMLLCVSSMFLVLVSPFQIFSLGESYRYWPSRDARECAILDFIYSLTYLLFNANSAINFLLYCVSGSKFRRALLSLFCLKSYAKSARNAQTNSNSTGSNRTGSTSGSGSSGVGSRMGSAVKDVTAAKKVTTNANITENDDIDAIGDNTKVVVHVANIMEGEANSTENTTAVVGDKTLAVNGKNADKDGNLTDTMPTNEIENETNA